MSQPDQQVQEIFSAYLRKVTSGIRRKSERTDTYSELLSHLWDVYDRNLAIGMTDINAAKAAVANMGDSDLLTYRLGAVHSQTPAQTLSSALNLLSIGIIFRIWVSFDGLDISSFSDVLYWAIGMLGAIPLFASLLRTRRLNKPMLAALFTYCAMAAVKIVFYGIDCAVLIPDQSLSSLISFFISYTLHIPFWIFLCTGLHKLCKDNSDRYNGKKPHFIACLVLNLISEATNILYLVLSWNEYEAMTATSGVIGIFSTILTAIQVLRLRQVLWDFEGEYGILPDDKSFKMMTASVTASCLIIIAMLSWYGAVKEPVKTEFILHDVSGHQIESAEAAREHMIALGLPEDIAYDLPDSEVLRYTEAIYMGTDTVSEGVYFESSNEDPRIKSSEKFQAYWFFLPTSDTAILTGTTYPVGEIPPDTYDVRVIFTSDKSGETRPQKKMRSSFFLSPAMEVYAYAVLDENGGSGIYTAIVTEEYGKKYLSKPLSEKNLGPGEQSSAPRGFEYIEEVCDQRIYFAQTFRVDVYPEEHYTELFGNRYDRYAATIIPAFNIMHVRRSLVALPHTTPGQYIDSNDFTIPDNEPPFFDLYYFGAIYLDEFFVFSEELKAAGTVEEIRAPEAEAA